MPSLKILTRSLSKNKKGNQHREAIILPIAHVERQEKGICNLKCTRSAREERPTSGKWLPGTARAVSPLGGMIEIKFVLRGEKRITKTRRERKERETKFRSHPDGVIRERKSEGFESGI